MSAAPATDTSALRNAVTVAGIVKHEKALQTIADANNGTRASGTAPTARTYVEGTDFQSMEYSRSGDVTGNVIATNDIVIPPGATAGSSNSGCEASDFTPASATQQQVALIQRGTCDFVVKARNAEAAAEGPGRCVRAPTAVQRQREGRPRPPLAVRHRQRRVPALRDLRRRRLTQARFPMAKPACGSRSTPDRLLDCGRPPG